MAQMFMKVGLPGSATTLAGSGYTAGDTTITVATTTNHPSDGRYVFAMDRVETVNGEQSRVPGTYCEFYGEVTSATTIAAVDLAFGTPQDYPAGVNTRVYIPVSSTRENDLIDGLSVAHNEDGTLKDGVVTTAKITNNSVTTEKLVDAAVTDTKWRNGIAFKAAPTGTVQFTDTEATKVFGREIYDIGSNYDAGTGTFTTPIAGIYAFIASVHTENAAVNRAFVSFQVTGLHTGELTVVLRGNDAISERAVRVLATHEYYLDAGATVKIRGYSAGTVTINNNESYWAGHLVTRV